MKGQIEALEILIKLKSTSGKIQKEKILLENKDNESLVFILEKVNNPEFKTGISKKKLSKVFEHLGSQNDMSYIDLIKYLDKNSTGKDTDIITVQRCISCYDEKYHEILSEIVCKNLIIGVTGTSLRKIGIDISDKIEVMLANNFADNKKFYHGRDMAISNKFDGERCVCLTKDTGIELYSRSGKRLDGYKQLISNLNLPSNCFVDGELLAIVNPGTSTEERRIMTAQKCRSKGDKTGLMLCVFDIMTLDEYFDNNSKPYKDRRVILDSLSENGYQEVNKVIKYYFENQQELIGKIVEVQYKGITADGDFQFATFQRVRDDK